MIRTNLSTRPFYNERAVRVSLLVFSLMALAATAFNATRVIQLSRQDTRLVTQAQTDETATIELRTRSGRLRASVDPRALEAASVDARLANELIGRRTFSWTELYNRFETTVPDDVRFVSTRSKLDPKRGIVLTIIAVAKTVDDINKFVDNLQATGAFTDVKKIDEHLDEQTNQWTATIEPIYTPANARPAAEGAER